MKKISGSIRLCSKTRIKSNKNQERFVIVQKSQEYDKEKGERSLCQEHHLSPSQFPRVKSGISTGMLPCRTESSLSSVMHDHSAASYTS